MTPDGWILGVIEGFYGRAWAHSDRLAMLPWLATQGYNAYLYAPKSDQSLRGRWSAPFEAAELLRLQTIASAAKHCELAWGVGFSPLGAVHDFGVAAQRALADKIAALSRTGPALLAILFDDMKCPYEDLAERQAHIVSFIAEHTDCEQLLMCPTYYSHDPILERVFGARPANYYQRLGELLPERVEVFWTGNEVCATAVDSADIADIQRQFGRPLTLWDNYPVNDGERASQLLHLQAFQQRDPALPQIMRGHFCNPMNQCAASRLPLATLPLLYAQAGNYDSQQAFASVCAAQLPVPLATQLATDLETFSRHGLGAMSAVSRQQLLNCYQLFDHPVAREIVDWLAGDYQFDPACLTETTL